MPTILEDENPDVDLPPTGEEVFENPDHAPEELADKFEPVVDDDGNVTLEEMINNNLEQFEYCIHSCSLEDLKYLNSVNLLPAGMRECAAHTSRSASRVSVPLAKATGITFDDDLMKSMAGTATGLRGASTVPKSSPTPMMLKRSLSPLNISSVISLVVYHYDRHFTLSNFSSIVIIIITGPVLLPGVERQMVAWSTCAQKALIV